jgi:hypothetical protein
MPVPGYINTSAQPGIVMLLHVIEKALQRQKAPGPPDERQCRPIFSSFGCSAPSA